MPDALEPLRTRTQRAAWGGVSLLTPRSTALWWRLTCPDRARPPGEHVRARGAATMCFGLVGGAWRMHFRCQWKKAEDQAQVRAMQQTRQIVRTIAY